MTGTETLVPTAEAISLEEFRTALGELAGTSTVKLFEDVTDDNGAPFVGFDSSVSAFDSSLSAFDSAL